MDNIVEMYCCPRQTQYVGKQPQTTKVIRLWLDKLTSQHVEYIFDVMSNTTQPIKNIMAHLRTTILNAPTTMEHYYQAQGQLADRTEPEEVNAVFHEERNTC